MAENSFIRKKRKNTLIGTGSKVGSFSEPTSINQIVDEISTEEVEKMNSSKKAKLTKEIIKENINTVESIDIDSNSTEEVEPTGVEQFVLTDDSNISTTVEKIGIDKNEFETIEKESTKKLNAKGIDVPKNVSAIEIEAVIDNIAEENNISTDDISVKIVEDKENPDKTKKYYKTIVKFNSVSPQLNKIASIVKSKSKGALKPRLVDNRVLGVINNKLMKDSEYKMLPTKCILFKPDLNAGATRVNKSTRIIIGESEDYSTTGNILIYIQESRSKKIIMLNKDEFGSVDNLTNFISIRILEYYTIGYNLSLTKMLFHSINTPLLDICNEIVKIGEFKVNISEENGYVNSVAFMTKDIINEDKIVYVEEIEGKQYIYRIFVEDTIGNIVHNFPGDFDISSLRQQLYSILVETFKRDWTIVGDEYDEFSRQFNKLTTIGMKEIAISVNDSENAKLLKAMSKQECKKYYRDGSLYNGEGIIIQLDNEKEPLIIVYYAHQFIGLDKRKGSQYITTDEYYNKYNVTDKNDYKDRKNTILAKQGIQRNYNARKYVYLLEKNGEDEVFLTLTEIINRLGLIEKNTDYENFE